MSPHNFPIEKMHQKLYMTHRLLYTGFNNWWLRKTQEWMLKMKLSQNIYRFYLKYRGKTPLQMSSSSPMKNVIFLHKQTLSIKSFSWKRVNCAKTKLVTKQRKKYHKIKIMHLFFNLCQPFPLLYHIINQQLSVLPNFSNKLSH